jgi:hypothetical protein
VTDDKAGVYPALQGKLEFPLMVGSGVDRGAVQIDDHADKRFPCFGVIDGSLYSLGMQRVKNCAGDYAKNDVLHVLWILFIN